jgi:8-oxo-dGTP pyrophosphatase MutT (NUDIX family)
VSDREALATVRAHPELARLADALAARPGLRAVVRPDDPEPKRAAVALVLRLGDDGTPELLFAKRAEYPGDPWSGHIAFPGGRREPGDRDAWDTAARETWEETGLDLRVDGVLLGTLDDLYPRNPALPNIVVRPHVAVAAPRAALTLSDELAAAFWVPITRFADPTVATTSVVQARGRALVVPSFVHEGHTIWGMTHRILQQLLERFNGTPTAG